MTTPWNQAAWKQNTYKPQRTTPGPVGADWPGKAEMLAKAIREHTARQDAEDAARGMSKPAVSEDRPQPTPVEHPQGWEKAETGVGQTLGQHLGIDPSEEEVAELNAPLLTLPEAAEACRRGKTVRCISGGLEPMLFRMDERGAYWMDDAVAGSRWLTAAFPDYPESDAVELRFEVVE